MKIQPTLETARLMLRPFTSADAPEVKRLAGDRAIASTTLSIPHPYEDGMAEAWIVTHRKEYESGKLANFAIVLRSDGALVGAIGLKIVAEHSNAELGYWIGKPFWNQGYATEAAEAVLRFAFEELDLNRVCASHVKRNPASGRVMKKIGMTHEGCRRQHVLHWGVFEDLELYGILKSDFGKNL